MSLSHNLLLKKGAGIAFNQSPRAIITSIERTNRFYSRSVLSFSVRQRYLLRGVK